MGNQTSEKVKRRAIELLYCWQKSMRHLTKFKQAYEMLKDQSIIINDPIYMDQLNQPSIPPPPARIATFEDDEKSKVCQCILVSIYHILVIGRIVEK